MNCSVKYVCIGHKIELCDDVAGNGVTTIAYSDPRIQSISQEIPMAIDQY